MLLLEADDLYLGDIPLRGDGSSNDAYVMEDGTVHTVLQINLQCYFEPTYPDTVQEMIEKSPDASLHGDGLYRG